MQEPLYALEIGTEIVFDCRPAIPEDWYSTFGDTLPCPALYEPLILPDYVITKIVNIKDRKE